ncbi:MAG: TlpA family protein disulfide reductase [Alloprevotella sp.]
MQKTKRVVAVATFVCCVLTAFAGGKDTFVQPGDTLPAFSIEMVNGARLTTETLKGRPVVLAFFNTNCLDCRRELPLLQRLHDEAGGAYRVVCVSRSQGQDEIAAYWQKAGLTLPYSPQTDRAVYSLFAPHGLPRVYVADGDGVVQAVFIEKVSARKLRKAIGQCMKD